MRVFEDREQGNTIQMVERIVTPFAAGDPGAVGGEDGLSSVREK